MERLNNQLLPKSCAYFRTVPFPCIGGGVELQTPTKTWVQKSKATAKGRPTFPDVKSWVSIDAFLWDTQSQALVFMGTLHPSFRIFLSCYPNITLGFISYGPCMALISRDCQYFEVYPTETKRGSEKKQKNYPHFVL